MRRRIGWFIALMLLVLPVVRAEAQLVNVRQVFSDTLADMAFMQYDPHGTPVVYINSTLTGPLVEFMIAHEYGHAFYQHPPVTVDRVRVAQELQADCYAAERVRPAAVMAAVKLFRQQGNHAADEWHPSGTKRANMILRCFAGHPIDIAARR